MTVYAKKPTPMYSPNCVIAALCMALFLPLSTTAATPRTEVLLSSNAATMHEQQKPDPDMDSLRAWLQGDFDTKEQIRHDSTARYAKLAIREFSQEGMDGLWFTFTLYADPDTTAPFQTLVLQVHRVEDGMIEVIQYDQAESGQKLKRRFGCEWYLQFSGKGFGGGTHGYACAATAGGAYSTTEVDIRSFGIKYWLRNYTSDRLLADGIRQTPLLFMRSAP